MLRDLDQEMLPFLHFHLQRLRGKLERLEQAKRTERGAYRHPDLSSPTQDFEKSLIRSYLLLFREVIASLRGRNDDVTSGRLHQARKETVSEAEALQAMDFWDIPEEEKDHGIDRTKLAAILALLLLWRSRHTRRAELSLADFFEKGRQSALQEIGVQTVASPDTQALKGTVLGRYSKDLDRLEKALREGSPRSHGIEWIVSHAQTLGEALALLRRLYETEQLRINLFAESLAWTAWSEGYRAGAVEGTIQKAKELGFVTSEGLSLAALTDAQREMLPHYTWMGPDDKRCCDPCRKQFEHDIVAMSLSDLPAPQDICRFGRGCRHWWELST